MLSANELLRLVTAKLSMCGSLTSGFTPGKGAAAVAGPVRMLPNVWLVGLRVYGGERSRNNGARHCSGAKTAVSVLSLLLVV